jgi:hypothetical protein
MITLDFEVLIKLPKLRDCNSFLLPLITDNICSRGLCKLLGIKIQFPGLVILSDKAEIVTSTLPVSPYCWA